jgi:hypothetical protein
MSTTLTGQFFAARLEYDNYTAHDEKNPAKVRVNHDGPGSLIHIWIGPINIAIHVDDWEIISDVVNSAIDRTLAKV